jgi:beta-phosphoglucomutase family hydrolase
MDFSSSTGLIFDCDGTLADTMPLHFIAWQTTLTRHGIDFPEDLFYSMAGQPTAVIVEKLLVAQDLTGDPFAISHEKELEFLKTLDDVQPIQPIVEIALRHRATHPMGVGSGSNRDTVLRILKNIGLENFFDAIVGAEDTERHKPEPDVFLEVAHRIGARPAGCCVFEDADLGVEAAHRAGMACFDVRDIFVPKRVTNG